MTVAAGMTRRQFDSMRREAERVNAGFALAVELGESRLKEALRAEADFQTKYPDHYWRDLVEKHVGRTR